jgi:hypothetical protein
MLTDLAQFTMPAVTGTGASSYTGTPFGLLAAGAAAGMTIGFAWHCLIYVSSPVKWFKEFLK